MGKRGWEGVDSTIEQSAKRKACERGREGVHRPKCRIKKQEREETGKRKIKKE